MPELCKKKVDDYLVVQFQNGNKKVFNLLVLRYQQRVIKLVARYIKDPVAAMDVTQETFIRAYRALPNFRGASAFYTWLFRIAINTAKNYELSKLRHPPDVDIDYADAEYTEYASFLNEINTPEHYIHCEELSTVVIETLKSLPEEMRQTILLRDVDGLSYEAISDKMSCPIGTVRSRIARAREMLSSKIQETIQR